MAGSSDRDPDRALIEQLAAAIAPDSPIEAGKGAAAIQEDVDRLDQLIGDQRERRAIRLWTNVECLVTTRRFAGLPAFRAAASESSARGWPVFVRASGGTTVVHRPGMLNVSLCETPRLDDIDMGARSELFCGDLARSLRSLGVPARTGWTAGSYCNGRFNITAKGRKIAGTASRLRQRQGWAGLLSHATIWIDGDTDADVAAITGFEQDLGPAPDYSAGAHTILAGWHKAPRSGT